MKNSNHYMHLVLWKLGIALALRRGEDVFRFMNFRTSFFSDYKVKKCLKRTLNILAPFLKGAA